ncbi:MAG TPA: amino acid adenylation domain-containing protein [Pyrinomonadaceae bacterium]
MNDQIKQMNGLSVEEKKRLLADLLQSQQRDPEKVPLSFAQERLWFLAQLEPENPSYNVPVALRLSGDLNVQALEKSINAIVARHETLRTTFALVDGEPFQFVSGNGTTTLEFVDLTSSPGVQVDIESQRLMSTIAERPFDLTQDHPLRASLIKLAPDDHLLVLTMHHIVSDAWSLNILIQELSRFYEAFTTHSEPRLSELPIQYRHYSEWQRDWLKNGYLQEQVDYWVSRLKGAAKLNLPTDHPRPVIHSYRGAHLSFKLSSNLTRKLNELSKAEGVTLFMTLLAAFKVLLFRYTGERDIVVGAPIAGRNRVETENLIGFFVNSLALRTDLSRNPTFRQLLGRVRKVAFDAYAHQDLPFEKLVEELNPARDISQTPIFQVMFGLQNTPRATAHLPSLTVKRVAVDSRTAKFDLTLLMSETADGLSGWFEYSADLFDQSTIERLKQHFENLLTSITLNPDGRITNLPFITAHEQQKTLIDWNATKTRFPRQSCIHDLFEEQALRRPDAVAVIFNDRKTTYAELNRKANKLANYLRKQGVGPDVIVGLAVERSVEMMVGLLAILKAGGAYIPLDPSYPHERLLFMIKQADVKLILTQKHLLDSLPAAQAKLIALDSDNREIRSEDDQNLPRLSDAQNLAYIMFTSGSTGEPKGVSVTHRNVARLVKDTNYARFDAGEVFLQFAPITFDAATFEIWGPLLNGAKLVVTAPGIESLENLGHTIEHYGVTTLWLTAGLFHQMADTGLRSLRGVRQLLAGGDVLSTPHVQKAIEALPNCQLINGYGPTENTTFTCCQRLKVDTISQSVPIGHPVSNTQVYVLSEDLQPVPIGVPGELFIGGDGLARGYLHDPSATAEKFQPNPFATEPGERLYRTGDQVRYRIDGSLEFLGRLDHQVKVRGYRVELGDVEFALSQHVDVKECVATTELSQTGEKRLIAFAVPVAGRTLRREQLRSFLNEKLPEYLVPSFIGILDSLPLTANGKIDRQALPKIEDLKFEEVFTYPRTPEEETIASIWRKLLGLEKVGIHDNFFELGGHSMLAVRLISEIEKVYNKKIPLSFLYQGATVEALAKLISGDNSYAHLTLLQIKPGSAQPPFFCVSGPDVNALGYVTLANHLGQDQPVYALQGEFRREIEGEYTPEEIEAWAADYLKAVRQLQPEGPYMLGGMCTGALIAFDMAAQLEAEGQEIALLAIFDTWDILTLNRLWKVDYYVRRMKFLLRQSRREQLNAVIKKFRGFLQNIVARAVPDSQPLVPHNPWKTGYKPNIKFDPKLYSGRLTVYRIQRQPYYRIRDEALGWRKRVRGGVDVEYVPGGHSTILRDPNAQVMARNLRERIQAVKRKKSKSFVESDKSDQGAETNDTARIGV